MLSGRDASITRCILWISSCGVGWGWEGRGGQGGGHRHQRLRRWEGVIAVCLQKLTWLSENINAVRLLKKKSSSLLIMQIKMVFLLSA